MTTRERVEEIRDYNLIHGGSCAHDDLLGGNCGACHKRDLLAYIDTLEARVTLLEDSLALAHRQHAHDFGGNMCWTRWQPPEIGKNACEVCRAVHARREASRE